MLMMAATVLLMVGVSVVVVFHQSIVRSEPMDCKDDVVSPSPPSNSILGEFRKAAVVSSGTPCSEIGKSMLVSGGNAVDAAIAVLLCDGVCAMQSMGVGGGFVMTLYNKSEGRAYSLIARETAPAAATQDMFVNNSASTKFGALAGAVPGELKGYQAMHERFGKLPWKQLFQPTIQLCEKGFVVSKPLAATFLQRLEVLRNSSTFMNTILNSTGGKLPKEGHMLKLPALAKTLRLIAESPRKAEEFYNGNLTAGFVADIQAGGGIITEQDLKNYQVRWEAPYNASLSGNYTVYSAALPGSGILVTFMLRLLDGLLRSTLSDKERSLYVIEAFKHAYGRRSGLGDPHFLKQADLDKTISLLTNDAEITAIRDRIKLGWTSNKTSDYGASYTSRDSGTNNIAVMDQEGSAISVTSTVNLYFGSSFVSTSTGILLNNEMDDFSTPGLTNFFGVKPSEANYIKPGKRPLSSMSPTIVLDSNGDVRLVVGGSGGTTITTQVTSVTVRNLWEGKNIKESIDKKRYHHQLDPMEVSYECGINKDLITAWKEAGHSAVRRTDPDHLAVVTAIARLGDRITASWDRRRPGSLAGI